MATNEVEVVLIGKDRGLSKTLRGAGQDAHTFSGMLKAAGKGLLFLGGVAVAAAVAAIAGVTAFVIKAKGAYEGWMTTVVQMNAATGLGVRASSMLAGQLQLSGANAKVASGAISIFSKTLDKARLGTGKTVTGFQRLHMALKDGHGNWKSLSTVLFEARRRLGGIHDAARRAGISQMLFGKGARMLGSWLLASSARMKEYTGWLKQAGLLMGAKSVAQFKQYREDQKHMSILWQGFQVSAFRALVPLVNQIMPTLISLMGKAATWMKRFANVATKRGLTDALREMVPGFTKLESVARKVLAYLKTQWPKAMAWIKENWPGIKQGLMVIADALGKVGGWVLKVSGWMKRHKTVVAALKLAFSLMNSALSFSMLILTHLGSIIRVASSVGRALWGVIKDIASVVKTVTVGGFSAVLSAIQGIIDAARTAYGWLQKLGAGPPRGPATAGQIRRQRRALGGPVNGPASGYPVVLHGRETVVAHNNPRRGLADLAASGIGGGGGGINLNVIMPGGTTLVGTAKQVAEILAPHVERALGRQVARSARGRA